ncbi:hypothetical protein SUGI_0783740 [Cryptomeria japonica]|nr:hypothetical protein SUGI_0783740 [Cryptomeria japonica]
MKAEFSSTLFKSDWCVNTRWRSRARAKQGFSSELQRQPLHNEFIITRYVFIYIYAYTVTLGGFCGWQLRNRGFRRASYFSNGCLYFGNALANHLENMQRWVYIQWIPSCMGYVFISQQCD